MSPVADTSTETLNITKQPSEDSLTLSEWLVCALVGVGILASTQPVLSAHTATQLMLLAQEWLRWLKKQCTYISQTNTDNNFIAIIDNMEKYYCQLIELTLWDNRQWSQSRSLLFKPECRLHLVTHQTTLTTDTQCSTIVATCPFHSR